VRYPAIEYLPAKSYRGESPNTILTCVSAGQKSGLLQFGHWADLKKKSGPALTRLFEAACRFTAFR
jgi:hypothetical protein